MPAVFVHGNPEDHTLWDEVRAELGDAPSVAVNLPGFGIPIPDGFDASKDSYLAWLIAELEKIGEPVDLVGHDWGAILSSRVIATRPDLLRTWAIDALSMHVPGAQWHAVAKIWQTPGAGEQWMERQDSVDDATRMAGLMAVGMPERYARKMAKIDPLRNDCILKLYRSAINVFEEWRWTEPLKRPGLHLGGSRDPYAPAKAGTAIAEQFGGIDEAVLEDAGHWWALDQPAQAAAALRTFWTKTNTLSS
jgi:pimeloyl-ACP methyl ester carboxylesterase